MTDSWWTLAAGAAALGIYWMTGKSKEKPKVTGSSMIMTNDPDYDEVFDDYDESDDYLEYHGESRGISTVRIPVKPTLNNLNSLLHDIYVRHVALKDSEFEFYYGLFHDIFHQIHRNMKLADPYYNRYSSTVQHAGSHYDRLRIKKPDEFDVDIIIGLPVNLREHYMNSKESDIVFEPKDAGFLQLRMGTQYKKLLDRDGIVDAKINRIAFKWIDDQGYLLRSKFMDWFKGVVDRALYMFNEGRVPTIYSGGVPYTVRKSESGPARTLLIENLAQGIRLDVDLVPALKFFEERWPISNSYRSIQRNWSNPEKFWMTVPKPNKTTNTQLHPNKSWRIGLHIQERKLMHNTYNLRQAIRLMKKLRDTMKMNNIASYYIKTLALWEALDRENWTTSPAGLFKVLVKRFYDALRTGKIPYFWNKNCNLLANINSYTLKMYADKLETLLHILEDPLRYKSVALYLLTPDELAEYRNFNRL